MTQYYSLNTLVLVGLPLQKGQAIADSTAVPFYEIPSQCCSIVDGHCAESKVCLVEVVGNLEDLAGVERGVSLDVACLSIDCLSLSIVSWGQRAMIRKNQERWAKDGLKMGKRWAKDESKRTHTYMHHRNFLVCCVCVPVDNGGSVDGTIASHGEHTFIPVDMTGCVKVDTMLEKEVFKGSTHTSLVGGNRAGVHRSVAHGNNPGWN